MKLNISDNIKILTLGAGIMLGGAGIVASNTKKDVVKTLDTPTPQVMVISADDLKTNKCIPSFFGGERCGGASDTVLWSLIASGTIGLGGVGFGAYRRRARIETSDTGFLESKMQPDSFFDDDKTSKGEKGDSPDGDGSMRYNLSQLDAIGEVDPIAEVDVYIAYGRGLQAIDILREAIPKEKNNERLKGGYTNKIRDLQGLYSLSDDAVKEQKLPKAKKIAELLELIRKQRALNDGGVDIVLDNSPQATNTPVTPIVARQKSAPRDTPNNSSGGGIITKPMTLDISIEDLEQSFDSDTLEDILKANMSVERLYGSIDASQGLEYDTTKSPIARKFSKLETLIIDMRDFTLHKKNNSPEAYDVKKNIIQLAGECAGFDAATRIHFLSFVEDHMSMFDQEIEQEVEAILVGSSPLEK